MFRLLIFCLIWLSSTRADTEMHEASDTMMNKMSMMDSSMVKGKRDSFPHVTSSPCPPFYPHIAAHVPQPMFIKPYYGPPSYPKNEVAIQQVPQHIKYIHQPTYQASSLNLHSAHHSVHQTHQPLIVKPLQYAVAEPKISYHKPLYSSYAPIYYNKPMYEIQKPYLNKIIYQKPSILYKPIEPISYTPLHQPKVVQIQQPISYLKATPHQPAIHSAPIYLPPVHQAKLPQIIPLQQPCD